MTAARTGDVADARSAARARRATSNDAGSWKGQTALMWAAHENNAPAIAALLAAGAERDARSTGGDFSALLFAVRAGALDGDARPARRRRRRERDAARRHERARARGDQRALRGRGRAARARRRPERRRQQGWTALHQIAWSRRWNMGFNLPGPAQTGSSTASSSCASSSRTARTSNARQTKEPADGNRNKLDRLGATPFLLAAKSCDVPLMRAAARARRRSGAHDRTRARRR